MKIAKIELSFTREELQESMLCQDPNSKFFSCQALDHYPVRDISCDDCPLNNVSAKEGIRYIRNHLE